jgi:mannose-6-phosphate isomerase-like protein (cupin superfamily)
VDPELLEAGKQYTSLGTTDQLACTVMVSTHGGENFLHQHPDLDQFFLVLDGEATFYTGVDEVGAVLGRWEGVIVPCGTEYWYEATPGQSVVLLRIGAHPADGEAPLVRLSENLRENIQIRTLEGRRFGAGSA